MRIHLAYLTTSVSSTMGLTSLLLLPSTLNIMYSLPSDLVSSIYFITEVLLNPMK